MGNKINRYEYAFLKGQFPEGGELVQGGAAWNVVFGFCKNNGYGGFGDPTEKGRAVMKQFEANGPIDYANI